MVLVHKHLIIRAEIKKPPKDVSYIKDEWIPWLVELIGMKILIGPFAVYSSVVGNRGMTAGCIIETSHLMAHFWDEDDPGMVQLDIYTCGPLDPTIANLALYEFEPIKVEMKYLDREHSLIELPLPTQEEIDSIDS
jgi:S-adenosylmethionine/arginine decarboxylase-like enzyme